MMITVVMIMAAVVVMIMNCDDNGGVGVDYVDDDSPLCVIGKNVQGKLPGKSWRYCIRTRTHVFTCR